MEKSKPLGENSVWEHSPSPGSDPNEAKNKKFFKEIQMNGILHPILKKTQPVMMMKRKKDFWTIAGDFIYRHHVVRRVKLYVPREETFPIPMKYIDVTRTTCSSLDVTLEENIEDYWNVDGERELSDAWTDITRFILLNERPPDGHTWSGGRLTRKQTTSRPDNVWPDMWTHVSVATKKKAKRRWAIEKPKFDNARELRGIFFKLTIKAARRKLEVPMPAAMLCKIQTKSSGENPPQYLETQDKIRLCWCRRENETKVRRNRTQTSPRWDHWKKGWILWIITILFTNSFRCLELWKFLQQKQRWTRNGKNWRKSRHCSWRKSETRNKWSMKQRRRALQFILHH